MNLVHCKTADEVRELARRYARKPSTPVVNLRTVFVPKQEPEIIEQKPEAAPVIDGYAVSGTVRDIGYEVAWKHCVSPEVIFSKERKSAAARARQEVMYRLRAEHEWSASKIARAMGGLDHTTVLSGIMAHATRNNLLVPCKPLNFRQWTDDEITRLRELCANGVRMKEIMRIFGCALHHIRKAKKKSGIVTRKPKL